MVMPHDYIVEVCLSNNYKDCMLFLVWLASVSAQYHKWWPSQEKMMPLSNVCECDENGPWTERVLAYVSGIFPTILSRKAQTIPQTGYFLTNMQRTICGQQDTTTIMFASLSLHTIYACCLIIPCVQNCYNRLAIIYLLDFCLGVLSLFLHSHPLQASTVWLPLGLTGVGEL